MIQSGRFSDTNSEARYGYGYNDSNPYYSGTGAYAPSTSGLSAYKTYSVVNAEPYPSVQVPLTIIDPPYTPIPRSYLAWSIFNLVCCGFICGLVTTILSVRIISLNDRKAIDQAQKLSDKLMLANIIISAAGGLIFMITFPYIYVAIYPYLPKINY